MPTPISPILGMNPALFSALMMMLAPQLLGKLFGNNTSQERLRAKMASLFQPGNLAARANENQDAWYKSPAYGAAQASSLAAGRMAEAGVQRAGAGVTSGMDVLTAGAAAGLGTATLGKFNADAYTKSRELAQRQAEAEANALLGGGMPQDISREMAGLSVASLGPMLTQWLGSRTPGTPAGATPAGAFAPGQEPDIWGDPSGSNLNRTTYPRNMFGPPTRFRPRTYFTPNRPNY